MKYKPKYSRRKSKKTQRMKMGILFVSIVVIIASGLIARKIFNNNETVQAVENNEAYAKDDNVSEDDVDSLKVESNTKIEKGEFVETYLEQQRRGQMPEGADGKKVVYLTFDDGPSETVTPHVLDVLKEENVNATFFVMGKSVDTNDQTKELLKREVEEGNSVGSHTYSHDYKKLYPGRTVNVDNFMKELDKTDKAIKNVLGDDFATNIVRLPGGHMSWKGTDQLDIALKEKGYSFIDWNALSKDAEGPKKNGEELAQEAIKSAGTKEKVVMLMHDTYGKEETIKSLPEIIHYFKNNGYEFKVIK